MIKRSLPSEYTTEGQSNAQMTTFKRPNLSLFIPQIAPPPEVSIEEHLRNSFNSLNDQMFANMNMPHLKEMMTQIMESCLNSLGQTFTCVGSRTELKTNNAVVNNNFFIGDYLQEARVTSVYVYACGDYVYKRSSFLVTDTNCFFKLILEICLQNYALSLNCGFKVPAIYDYVLLQHGDHLSIEIKMERVKMLNVENEAIKDEVLRSSVYLIKKIKDGLTCFQNHGLYHNDTHSDNLGFYRDQEIRGIQVVLMDFGKATLTPANRYPSISGFYEELRRKFEFEQWFSRVISRNFWGRTLHGGRKKRTRRNKKQRKRKTHRRK
jgi:hypothetical protein